MISNFLLSVIECIKIFFLSTRKLPVLLFTNTHSDIEWYSIILFPTSFRLGPIQLFAFMRVAGPLHLLPFHACIRAVLPHDGATKCPSRNDCLALSKSQKLTCQTDRRVISLSSILCVHLIVCEQPKIGANNER